MMKIPLYTQVALKCNLRKYCLQQGDIATVVDYLEGDENLPNAYVLEAFNALGETIGVFTLPHNKVTSLSENEVLHVRQLIKTG